MICLINMICLIYMNIVTFGCITNNQLKLTQFAKICCISLHEDRFLQILTRNNP